MGLYCTTLHEYTFYGIKYLLTVVVLVGNVVYWVVQGIVLRHNIAYCFASKQMF